MNQYWIIALLSAFTAVGFAGYRYGYDSEKVSCDKLEAAQQQVTIAGQQHVITEVAKQQTITTGVSNAYHTGINAIDNLYSVQSDNTSSGDNHTIPSAASRPDAAVHKPSRTKYYKLTKQECDDNTAHGIGIQDWVKGQQTVH